MRMLMNFSNLVVFALLLESLCFFYVAHWITSLSRIVHAPPLQVLLAGWPDSLEGLLFVGAAVAYWGFARARPWLRVLALAAAVGGMYDILFSQNLVHSYWGVFQGDVIAISAISSVGLVVIGVLAAIDHYVSKAQRNSLPERLPSVND